MGNLQNTENSDDKTWLIFGQRAFLPKFSWEAYIQGKGGGGGGGLHMDKYLCFENPIFLFEQL